MNIGTLDILENHETLKTPGMTHVCDKLPDGSPNLSVALCGTTRDSNMPVRWGKRREIDCVVCAELGPKVWAR